MGADAQTIPLPCTILITGSYNVGKKRIVNAFTNVAFDKLLSWDNDQNVQLKATKGHITLQGIPEQFGRFPAYREMIKAIVESHAYIIMAPLHGGNTIVSHVNDYFDNIVKNRKGNGPIMLLLTYSSVTVPAIPAEITKWAKGKASISLINPDVLQATETEKLIKMINELAMSASTFITATPPSPSPTSTPTPLAPTKATTSSSPNGLVRLLSSIFSKKSTVTAAA